MNIHFFLLNISVVLFIALIIKYKEYRKPLAVFFVILSTIFYTPVFYYFILEGSAYRAFNSVDLKVFTKLSFFCFLSYSLLLVIKNNIPRIKKKSFLRRRSVSIVKLYMMVIIVMVTLYTIIFFKEFPLTQAVLFGNKIIRPDTSGNLPFYFTLSVLMQFIIPSFYFYIIENFEIKKNNKIFLFIGTVLIMSIGGNKGVLVYFLIFYWIYLLEMKVNIRITIMTFFSFFIYRVLDAGGGQYSNINEFIIQLASPLRRFFVTQGAMFINRIHLINVDYNFSSNLDISKEVFNFVYGYTGGSAPTYFLGDLVINYGFIIGFAIHMAIISILFLYSEMIDLTNCNFTKWSFYSILFLLGMSGISKSFYLRFLAIVLNVLIIKYFSSKKTGKT